MIGTTQQILQAGLDKLRAAIIERENANGLRASGRTEQKLAVQATSATHGELLGPSWIAVWEDGRRPGKVPFEFYKIIVEWAEAKGITWASADPATFERWAKGVAWHIKREGTRQYRSGQQLDVFKTPIAELERWLADELKIFYAAQVANDLRTAWAK